VTGSGSSPERYLVGIQPCGVHDDARGDRFALERDVEPVDARLAAHYLRAAQHDPAEPVELARQRADERFRLEPPGRGGPQRRVGRNPRLAGANERRIHDLETLHAVPGPAPLQRFEQPRFRLRLGHDQLSATLVRPPWRAH
jgi:hypothetical protein